MLLMNVNNSQKMLAWISSDYLESLLLPQCWEEKTTRSNRVNFRLRKCLCGTSTAHIDACAYKMPSCSLGLSIRIVLDSFLFWEFLNLNKRDRTAQSAGLEIRRPRWQFKTFQSRQPVWISPVGILNLVHHHSVFSVGMLWIILFHTFRSDIEFARFSLSPCLWYLNYCCL